MMCSKTLYENIANFLLECPIDEIGHTTVSDIVQSYQLKMISKKDAVCLITEGHKPFLEKFVQLTMMNYSNLYNEKN